MLYVSEKGKPAVRFPTGFDTKLEAGKLVIVDAKGETVTKALDATGKDIEVADPFDIIPGGKGVHTYPIVVRE